MTHPPGGSATEGVSRAKPPGGLPFAFICGQDDYSRYYKLILLGD